MQGYTKREFAGQAFTILRLLLRRRSFLTDDHGLPRIRGEAARCHISSIECDPVELADEGALRISEILVNGTEVDAHEAPGIGPINAINRRYRTWPNPLSVVICGHPWGNFFSTIMPN